MHLIIILFFGLSSVTAKPIPSEDDHPPDTDYDMSFYLVFMFLGFFLILLVAVTVAVAARRVDHDNDFCADRENENEDDDDYRDVGMETNALFINNQPSLSADIPRQVNENYAGKRVRGQDIHWLEVFNFATTMEYKESGICKELKDRFTCMRKRSPDYADTEHYVCKFSRKVGYIPCKTQYMVKFFSHNDEVNVACNEESQEHRHELDPELADNGINFRWTAEQNVIIQQGVLNEAKPRVRFSTTSISLFTSSMFLGYQEEP